MSRSTAPVITSPLEAWPARPSPRTSPLSSKVSSLSSSPTRDGKDSTSYDSRETSATSLATTMTQGESSKSGAMDHGSTSQWSLVSQPNLPGPSTSPNTTSSTLAKIYPDSPSSRPARQRQSRGRSPIHRRRIDKSLWQAICTSPPTIDTGSAGAYSPELWDSHTLITPTLPNFRLALAIPGYTSQSTSHDEGTKRHTMDRYCHSSIFNPSTSRPYLYAS